MKILALISILQFAFFLGGMRHVKEERSKVCVTGGGLGDLSLHPLSK